MNKQNNNHTQKTKAERREVKKKRKMKVSGAGVKELQKLITRNA